MCVMCDPIHSFRLLKLGQPFGVRPRPCRRPQAPGDSEPKTRPPKPQPHILVTSQGFLIDDRKILPKWCTRMTFFISPWPGQSHLHEGQGIL
jgi:hypothetical protein